MTEKHKKRLKKVGWVAGGAALLVVAYVFGNKPAKVAIPCHRSCYRADGCPKKAFDKPWKANLQSVKQLLFHGELCNSYQVGDKFYTGHSKNAPCRSINPLKLLKKTNLSCSGIC